MVQRGALCDSERGGELYAIASVGAAHTKQRECYDGAMRGSYSDTHACPAYANLGNQLWDAGTTHAYTDGHASADRNADRCCFDVSSRKQ